MFQHFIQSLAFEQHSTQHCQRILIFVIKLKNLLGVWITRCLGPDSLLHIVACDLDFVFITPFSQNQTQFHTTRRLFFLGLVVPFMVVSMFGIVVFVFLFCHFQFLFDQIFRQIHFNLVRQHIQQFIAHCALTGIRILFI